jgi:hypothetical protein
MFIAIITILLLLILAGVIYVATSLYVNSVPGVWVSSKEYHKTPIIQRVFYYPDKIRGVSKYDVIFAKMFDDGPKWERNEILVCNRAFENVKKGKYYLFEHRNHGAYRIVQCTATADGLPEVFDGNETYLTHNCLAEVIGVYNDDYNELRYDI